MNSKDYTNIEQLRLLFDDWIHHSFAMTLEQLGLYRIMFCVYMLLIVGVPNFSSLSKNPDYIFSPPAISLAAFFDGFPNYYFLLILSFLLYVFFVFLLFGYKTKMVSIAISLMMLVGYNFYYSFGKIDHNILLVLLPLIMAFSGWGEKYSIEQSKNEVKSIVSSNWPVTLVALLLAFAMFTAGVPKLYSGWLDFDTHAVQGHFYYNYIEADRTELLATFFAQVEQPFFWESMDYLAVFFEIGFLLSLVKANWFKLFVFLAIIFHLINLFIFNIAFAVHIPIYLLFINWNHFEQQLLSTSIKKKINTFFSKQSMLFCGLFLLLLWAYFVIVEPIPLWDHPSIIKLIFTELELSYMLLYLIVLISAFILGLIQIIAYYTHTHIK